MFSNNEADLELGDFGILFLLFNEGLGLSPDRIKDLKAFSNMGLFQIMSSMAPICTIGFDLRAVAEFLTRNLHMWRKPQP